MSISRLLSELIVILAALILLGSCAGNKGNHYPLDASYLRYEDLGLRLTALMKAHPDDCRLHLIGFSGAEQLPLYALQIGGPGLTRKALVIGQHHGDEVLGIEVALALAKNFLTGKDKATLEILKNFQIWIVPTINPEGWRVVSGGQYQWKRRNNRDTNGNGVLDLREDGVDLNRNYPLFWELDQLTAVTDPYYKGPAPGSEAEVQAIMKLAGEEKFELAVFYHSSASGAYNEKLYLPSNQGLEKHKLEDFKHLTETAEYYASQVKKDYQKGTYEVRSQGNSRMGNARNYFFFKQNCQAFLIEIGGINQAGVPIVHPPAAMMHSIRSKHVNAFKNTLLRLLEQKKD